LTIEKKKKKKPKLEEKRREPTIRICISKDTHLSISASEDEKMTRTRNIVREIKKRKEKKNGVD
jgi:hypothetical protein